MAKPSENTLLLRDPLTGRNVGEACFNGQHKSGVDSLCRAVMCQCVCHDAKEPRAKKEPASTGALPFTGPSIPIRSER